MTQIAMVRTIKEIREIVQEWKGQKHRVALLPTMGALHEGHLSLVRLVQTCADKVIVSIFVNPRQFGPDEDWARYPHTLEADYQKCAEIGTDLVYCPDIAEMYGPQAATTVSVSGISQDLCGASRPGHFDGVATVVAKLLNQVQPHVAIFGEKDYQQLSVIKQMVGDLDIPVEVLSGPIQRDEHGLALSSRNSYLSAKELTTASQLNKILFDMARQLSYKPVAQCLENGQHRLQEAGFERIEYLTLRDAVSLQPVDQISGSARLLAAVHLGSTRLIDNVPVN